MNPLELVAIGLLAFTVAVMLGLWVFWMLMKSLARSETVRAMEQEHHTKEEVEACPQCNPSGAKL
jgi:hypothetical protein